MRPFNIDDRELFDAIKRGIKTVEGRKGTLTWRSYKVGDIAIFRNGDELFEALIVGIREYPNIKVYLENEGLERTLPLVAKNIDEGVNYYKNRCGWMDSEIEEFGVLAFEIN